MSSQGASRSCVRVCLSVGLSLAILTVVVGVLLFAFKLLLTKTATWVERTFNADTTAAAEIANEHTVPQAWLDEGAGAADPGLNAAAAKRRVLGRLDQLLKRVEGGRAFEPDAREHALAELRAVRARWQTQSWQEMLAPGGLAVRREAPDTTQDFSAKETR